MPKKFSYNDTFEKYITSFLQNFSVDDQGKFDLLAFKNSKYLFYRFNDFLKIYGNPRYKLLHTRKMVDSKALEKLENKNKQFMIEKIIQGVEFENASQSNPEKNPEIIKTRIIIELLGEFTSNFSWTSQNYFMNIFNQLTFMNSKTLRKT